MNPAKGGAYCSDGWNMGYLSVLIPVKIQIMSKKMDLVEKGLTLYATGKFESRQHAFKAAKEQHEREEKKRLAATKTSTTVNTSEPPEELDTF